VKRLSVAFRAQGSAALILALAGLIVSAMPVNAGPVTATAAVVNVGSPSGQTPQNHQNEPAVAIDAHNPDLLVAGVNDFVDQQPCPRTLVVEEATCNLDNGVGVSGVYFSFDRGRNWTQPTYTGLTARDCGSESPCEPHLGPIGRLPWYYESGLVDAGDPWLAIGPRPVDGAFSWENGSRVYYSNISAPLSDYFANGPQPPPGSPVPRGYSAIAVSRLDDPTPERVTQKSSWMPPVIVASHQGSTDAEDKEGIWADNAASSPYFGNVYMCVTEFRSNGGHGPSGGFPGPLTIGTSSDGGDTWRVRQVTSADGTGQGEGEWGRLGCTIRTDSHGVVYVFILRDTNPALGLPARGTHELIQSFDGGAHWTRPRALFTRTDLCYHIDPLSNRCVTDGYTGARTEGAVQPSVDLANGAPTGADATDLIINAWPDANDGLNNEKARVAWSSDGARTWQGFTAVSLPGDRPLFAAPAISPAGDRAYVVYEAVTSPWPGSDLTSPRPYHGVLLTAPIGPGGPGVWTTAYEGPFGDLRGTFPGHRLREERVGDYVYAAASRDYGVGLWIDARDAAVCPAIQDWRAASLAAGEPVIPAPWPLADCPETFGNTDVWSATTG